MSKKQNKFKTLAFWKTIGVRFFRAFVTGALAGASVVTIGNPTTWTDVQTVISALLVSAIIGGFNGVLAAFDKGFRYKV